MYILVVSYTLVLYFIIYRMYVKINVLYVHCTAYILHILDLARVLVFNAAHSTLHKIAFRMNGRWTLYSLYFSLTLRPYICNV